MTNTFKPGGCATLIGSQPLKDHDEATGLVLTHTPDIPTWVQLPTYRQEGMVPQYAPGLPGLVRGDDNIYVDTRAADFDEQVLAFFEAYLDITEQGADWDGSRFVLTDDTAPGFSSLVNALENRAESPKAVKGQITGPITFCTSLKDEQGRPIFYNDTLRDAAVKLLALKAGWQARRLSRYGAPVIVFIDEPALAGFGSSEFISISKEDIEACLRDVIIAIHDQNALAGVHVCANTDWSLLLDSSVDIINFDAFAYFEKFMLYGQAVASFLGQGRILAWGLVPTLGSDNIEAATVDSLWQDWQAKSRIVCDLGVDRQTVIDQAIISPSCGTGPLTPPESLKVLELTKALSDKIRDY